MAGAGAKLFTSGSVLTADQVNTYLMDQTIMKFASTSARDAAFGGAGEPTLAEGMFAYTTDTNTLWLYDGSNWVNVLGSDIGQQALSNRNVVINGAMQVAQRGLSTASITTTGYYTADRFQTLISSAGTWTQTVESDAPTGSGFRNSLKMLCTTADASLSAGDYATIRHNIEGQNVQQFAKGTASAKQFALSFWVKSNVTGTYVARLFDVTNSRSVSATYTVSVSATWEKKTIVFPADTSGVIANDNTNGILIDMWLVAGSNFSSGTLNTSWASEISANVAVGQTNLASAINNYWQVTGVQLEAGAVATPFEFEDYGVTLAKCQRYYTRFTASTAGPYAVFAVAGMTETTTSAVGYTPLPVELRSYPSSVEYGGTIRVVPTGTEQTVTAISLQDRTNTKVLAITYTVASGLTGSQYMSVRANNSSTAYLGVSAEL